MLRSAVRSGAVLFRKRLLFITGQYNPHYLIITHLIPIVVKLVSNHHQVCFHLTVVTTTVISVEFNVNQILTNLVVPRPALSLSLSLKESQAGSCVINACISYTAHVSLSPETLYKVLDDIGQLLKSEFHDSSDHDFGLATKSLMRSVSLNVPHPTPPINSSF